MFSNRIYSTGARHAGHPGQAEGGRCRSFGPGHRGSWGAFAGPRGRGRKARRGDIRTAALILIAEEPRNGYQIMQDVEERSGGMWRPSPGSVYPALAQLEDEGLIRSEEHDSRKLYAITDAGREAVEARGERPAPWEQLGGDVGDEVQALGRLAREVSGAFVQLMRTGSPGQMSSARDVLAATRRDLYRILADGDPGEEPGDGAAAEGEQPADPQD